MSEYRHIASLRGPGGPRGSDGVAARGSIPEEITALEQMNTSEYNGLWQIGSGRNVEDVPFEIVSSTLVEIAIGSPATAGKQIVSNIGQSWWREANLGGFSGVSTWGPWRKYSDLEGTEAIYADIPNLDADTDAEMLPPGDYRVSSNAVAESFGLPSGFSGFLEVRRIAPTNGIMQRWTPWMPGGAYPNQQWVRTGRTNGEFSDWTRIGAIQSNDIESIRVTTNPAEVGGDGELVIVVEP